MKKDLGSVLALYPTPLVVVGAMVNGKPNWVLVGHVGIMGHDHVMVSLAKPHYTNQGISYAGYGSVPKELPDEKYNADLVATYEELLSVPYQDKVTDYFGDYSLHHFRHGMTTEQVEPVYEKALAAMEMTEEEFKQADYLYRGDIVNRMRDCLLAKELRTGEEVLFVATEPYGGEGDFAFRGGLVMAVDAEQKTCKMRGDFFDMENVPLHYVLGRHDMSAGKHYGVDHVQPLFGEHPALAQHYLKEVEEAWNAKWNDGQVQEEESAPALSM